MEAAMDSLRSQLKKEEEEYEELYTQLKEIQQKYSAQESKVKALKTALQLISQTCLSTSECTNTSVVDPVKINKTPTVTSIVPITTVEPSSSTKPFLEKKKEPVMAVSADRAKITKDLEEVNKIMTKSKLPKKDYYVVFNGSGKGIYDEWHKASLFITNQKGIIHKKYPTLEQAKDAYEDFNNNDNSFREKLIRPAPPTTQKTTKAMTLLGSIPTSGQIQEQMRLNKTDFEKGITFLKTWSLEKRMELSYYPVNNFAEYSKIVAIEDANPLTIFKLWKYGLIHQIHITDSLKCLEKFPANFKSAVIRFRMITKSQRQVLRFISSLPVFGEDGEIIFPSLSFVKMMIDEYGFPAIDEEMKVDSILNTKNIANSLITVWKSTTQYNDQSFMRISYKSPDCLLWSVNRKVISEGELEQLLSFDEEFRHFTGRMSALPEEIKLRLCFSLRAYSVHTCEMCQFETIEDYDAYEASRYVSAEDAKEDKKASSTTCKEESSDSDRDHEVFIDE